MIQDQINQLLFLLNTLVEFHSDVNTFLLNTQGEQSLPKVLDRRARRNAGRHQLALVESVLI